MATNIGQKRLTSADYILEFSGFQSHQIVVIILIKKH